MNVNMYSIMNPEKFHFISYAFQTRFYFLVPQTGNRNLGSQLKTCEAELSVETHTRTRAGPVRRADRSRTEGPTAADIMRTRW